jgi:branched-chain amino acid aminotransferase
MAEFQQAWLTGTAAEVTPIGSIGPYSFEVGELTRSIAGDYERLARGTLQAA